MSDNFKNSVDKFDSGELTGVEAEEILKKIAAGANTLGERELRKQLEVLHREHSSSTSSKKWMYGIAASLLIGISTYLVIGNKTDGNPQLLQIDSSPIYGDSAVYQEDSVQTIIEIDTLKKK